MSNILENMTKIMSTTLNSITFVFTLTHIQFRFQSSLGQQHDHNQPYKIHSEIFVATLLQICIHCNSTNEQWCAAYTLPVTLKG